MTAPTQAESKKTRGKMILSSPSAGVADGSADSLENVIAVLNARVDSDTASVQFDHGAPISVASVAPNDTAYANAPIGSRVHVFLTDSAETNPYEYEDWVKTKDGWHRTDDGIRVTEVTIATAAVKTLNATPVDVIPAPGAGYGIQLLGVEVFLDYATTAYDGIAAGEDLTLKYTNGSGAVLATVETTGFLDASADALAWAPGVAATIAANAKVVAHMLAGEIATGDSPITIRAKWRKVAIG